MSTMTTTHRANTTISEQAKALAEALGADVDAAKALKRLLAVGVVDLWQVPLYLPSRFLDAREPISQFFGLTASDREEVLIGHYAGDFRTRWHAGRRGGRHSPQAQGSLVDTNGMRIKFSLFGDARSFQKALEEAGEQVALAGTLNQVGAHVYLNNPVLLDPGVLGQLVPHYPGKARVLSLAMARRVIPALLPQAIPACAAKLRADARTLVDESALRQLLARPHGTLEDLLWEAHLPTSPEAGERAQWSLERLSALLTVGELRKLQHEHPPVRQQLHIDEWRDLLTRIPFQLTDEQRNAAAQLVRRFGGEMTSSTLINADVGMGKSIVYQLATAAGVRAGARAAVLLPNERLAVQAYEEISRLFPEWGATLVTGKSGVRDVTDTQWLIGTTAMLFRDVGHLDICVVDEQHRFSVDQRRALSQDGTHLVEISATPIPRTQALLLYGKLDVIRLTKRHSPQDIQTQIVERAGTSRMVDRLHQIIDLGGRVLIVCPRREEDEEDEGGSLPSVARVAEKWERLFPGLVRSLHGESDPNDVEIAFADLASGHAQILVATTVVEVGLNIQNLRAVVIVHAERFGLSQLHQLRGRLAREGGSGECFLYLPQPVGVDAATRLQALVATSDGFELADHDMRIRGIGDISAIGERQHGSAGSLLMNRAVPMSTFLDVLETLGAP
ncbi:MULTISPECIES: DEAD/DEAH box helicase [Thermomonas]|jgi:ATP-dependent DNA helicase RecG|uniref:DEAD/DEAH box helicase n=1 Tax=Thermomonas TaxID=141948 RepID=UPI00041A1456|nr:MULTISPECIES: DEAD/DEAH box helicase [Thermomonas]